MSHTESQLQFFIGKTAMIPCGSWLKSEMKGKIPDGFELGCFNLPIVPNRRAAAATRCSRTSNYFFVMSKSKHPREGGGVPAVHDVASAWPASSRGCRTSPTAVKGASKGNLSPDMDDLVALIDKAEGELRRDVAGGTRRCKQISIDMMQERHLRHA